MLQIALTYPVVVGPPTGTDRETQLLSQTAGSLRSPAVRQVCPPTGAFRMVKSSDKSFGNDIGAVHENSFVSSH